MVKSVLLHIFVETDAFLSGFFESVKEQCFFMKSTFFFFFSNSVFSILNYSSFHFNFLDSFLMVKLNFINQKTCLIN